MGGHLCPTLQTLTLGSPAAGSEPCSCSTCAQRVTPTWARDTSGGILVTF